MGKPNMVKTVIGELKNEKDENGFNLLTVIGDINKDGLPDVVIAQRNGKLVWLENKGVEKEWEQHIIDEIGTLEAGGVLYDLTGNGYPDLIIGEDYRGDGLYWWENPGAVGQKWTRRVIVRTSANQFHDQAIGDVTGDGKNSLIFWNQQGKTLYRVPLPEDPRISPWPGIEVIQQGVSEEGIAIADIDGDGVNEVIAGCHWYKYTGLAKRPWEMNRFAKGYIATRVAAGDLDGDGKLEIVLSEGDACIYGKPQGGKIAWFKQGDDIRAMWEENILDDFMLDPHSLQLGDFCGHGAIDIFAGEIGVKESILEKKPRLIIYENDGRANFTRHIIDTGTGTHEAKAADMWGRGVLDIVGKPLHGPEKWNIHIWKNIENAR